MPGRDRQVVDGDISCPSVGNSDGRPWGDQVTVRWGIPLAAYGEFRVAAVRPIRP